MVLTTLQIGDITLQSKTNNGKILHSKVLRIEAPNNRHTSTIVQEVANCIQSACKTRQWKVLWSDEVTIKLLICRASVPHHRQGHDEHR